MNSEVIKDDLLKNNYGIECEGYGNYEGRHIGGYRYQLEITITNSNSDKVLACIMMNPSTTFPDVEWENPNWKNKLCFPKSQKRKTKGFDPTVRNVIRMANSKGYSKVCIFNLFPYIQPTGSLAKDEFGKDIHKGQQKINGEKIDSWNEKCDKVLIAWGSTLSANNLQKEYINKFKQKGIQPVYYEWNDNKGCPYHPSIQVNNSLTKKGNKIVKKGKGEPGLIQQFIDDKKAEFKNYPKQ